MEKKNAKSFLYRGLCGFFLGISVIAPGVSGSIMAVMMGIYDRLITIISNPFKDFKKSFTFLLPMAVGGVLSVGIFVKILDYTFSNFPFQSYLLFISLIAGSLPTVFGEAKEEGIKKRYFIGLILAFAFALTIGILGNGSGGVHADPNNIVYLCIAGAVAGATSMIPGMSISLILMLLGVYQVLMSKVDGILGSGFNIADCIDIGLIVLSFGIGMILFSQITKIVFTKFKGLAYFMVFGFMLGSVSGICLKLIGPFPGTEAAKLVDPNTPTTAAGIFFWYLSVALVIAAGLYISLLFTKLSEKMKTE